MLLHTLLPPSLSSRALGRRIALVVGAFALASFSVAGCAATPGAVSNKPVSSTSDDSGDASSAETDAGMLPASAMDAGSAPSQDDGGASADSAAVGAAPAYQGSPLCNAAAWNCYPDNPPSPLDCDVVADAGLSSGPGGYDHGPLACHVEHTADGQGVVPVCTVGGFGGDGSPCNQGSDCAPGNECVVGGICRPYCCAGTCSNSHEFCDIETAGDTGLSVPVCAPMHSCTLLPQVNDPNACRGLETCEVVGQETGATSCVDVGTQQVGQECDTANCVRGLTCVGQPGKRSCFKLCHTTKTGDCATGQTCTGGFPLFPAPGVGICK